VRRSVVVVCNILLKLRSFVLRNKSDLKKRGKTLKEVKICALIRVR
jgi:hypothetical protein